MLIDIPAYTPHPHKVHYPLLSSAALNGTPLIYHILLYGLSQPSVPIVLDLLHEGFRDVGIFEAMGIFVLGGNSPLSPAAPC
ncbi:hypothetical protein FKM82_017568 [Ascaphus truei]